MKDPDIITPGNRLTSFNWLYVNVLRKSPDYTFTIKSTKHLVQNAKSDDAIQVESLIYAK